MQVARDLIARVICDAGIDGSRVYSTGLSNGAFLSSRIGCELGDVVAAIAPVAGLFVPGGVTCKRSMPVLAFHGTADAVVPYEHGLILGLIPYEGAEDAATDWALVNGADPGCDLVETAETHLSDHVQRFTASACGHLKVALIVVEGGGHTWPGAAIDIPSLGVTTHEISASEMIWEFFKEKRLPPP